MIREGIPKRSASMSKTTRGKSNVDMTLGEEIEGGRCIEGQLCGVNGGQE